MGNSFLPSLIILNQRVKYPDRKALQEVSAIFVYSMWSSKVAELVAALFKRETKAHRQGQCRWIVDIDSRR